jgi:hypothetical protein
MKRNFQLQDLNAASRRSRLRNRRTKADTAAAPPSHALQFRSDFPQESRPVEQRDVGDVLGASAVRDESKSECQFRGMIADTMSIVAADAASTGAGA